MYFAEKRLTLAILTLVAVTGLLVDFVGLDRQAGGATHAARAGAS